MFRFRRRLWGFESGALDSGMVFEEFRSDEGLTLETSALLVRNKIVRVPENLAQVLIKCILNDLRRIKCPTFTEFIENRTCLQTSRQLHLSRQICLRVS